MQVSYWTKTGVFDTHLNDAYVRGAVDFMHSRVKNQGCLVMNIENAGASYEYMPMGEVHKSRNFAIGLSGLDLRSADAFAYSLGRDLASSAASMGAGMLASEAGMGGFVSTLAASLAGTYVNTEVLPQRPSDGSRPTGFGSTGSVSYDRNGVGFQAVNVEFDRAEFNAVVNQIKANIFAEALDEDLSTEETVERIEIVEEWAEDSIRKSKAEGKSDKEAIEEVRENVEVVKEVVKIDQEVRKDTEPVEPQAEVSMVATSSVDDATVSLMLNRLTHGVEQESLRDQAVRLYTLAQMVKATENPTIENRTILVRALRKFGDIVSTVICGQEADAMPAAIVPAVAVVERIYLWVMANPQAMLNLRATAARAINLGQILERSKKASHSAPKASGQMPSANASPNLTPNEPKKPRVNSTMQDSDRYLSGLKQQGALSKKGVTKDGHEYYRFEQKCEYKGIKFKKGDYISRDELHHEWEWFRGTKDHRGAINSVTGEKYKKAISGRELKLP